MTKTRKKASPPRDATATPPTPREPPDPHAVEKLRGLIREIGTAMLTVVDEDGFPRSMPMATQDADGFDGTLWFLTDKHTRKVREIERDEHVGLTYADPSSNRYVSVTGRASLVEDRAKLEELWSLAHLAWFPKGKQDPDILLLKVEVDRAEYWDSPGGAVVQAIGFAKAVLTGERYQGGENEELKLH